jgi:phosphopantetheinyl transferase
VSCPKINVYIRQTDEMFDASAAVLSAARIYAADKTVALPLDLGFSKDDFGKPYFAGAPKLHVSLSHSGAYWLCAFSLSPLGIDIQKRETCRMNAVSRRFFHEKEYQYLEATGYKDFFMIWTAKESYVKYTGKGIDDGFGCFSVIINNGIAKEIAGVQLRFLPFFPGYTVCVCAKDTATVSLALFDEKSGRYQDVRSSDLSG